ncbi:MAG: alpha/beta hydrolase [Candidatus Limnocylindrales bacterium]
MDVPQREPGAPLSANTVGEADRQWSDELEAEYERFLAVHADRSIQVGGHAWHYLAGGRGPDAVLMLPGGSMCPDSYFRLIGELEREHRVIAPTYPAAPTIVDLITGLRAVLDAEGVSRVTVYGASFGGYLAQAFVRRQPERVDRLVLSHTAPRHMASGRSMAALAALLSALPAPLVKSLMWRIWMRLFSMRSPEREFWRRLLRAVLDRLSKAQLVAVTRCMADFGRYRMTPQDLAGWAGAVLILESTHDAAYGPEARAELRAAYPTATVYTFRDAGHTALWTHADEYNEVVRAFLAHPIRGESAGR